MPNGRAILPRADGRTPATGKGAQTRQRLLDAARDCFEDRGYLDTRVADIAGAAGVAHGTFYKYFESKDDVFRELTNQVVAAMFERTRRRERHPDPVTRITMVNWRYLNAYRDDARFLAIVWQVAMFDPTYRQFWVDVRQRWADTIEKWVELEVSRGTADTRLDARIAGRALGLMMESFAHHWFVLGEEYDDHTALATLTQLWLNGLRLSVDGDHVDVRAIAAGVIDAATKEESR